MLGACASAGAAVRKVAASNALRAAWRKTRGLPNGDIDTPPKIFFVVAFKPAFLAPFRQLADSLTTIV
jgi:hypothetical protein